MYLNFAKLQKFHEIPLFLNIFYSFFLCFFILFCIDIFYIFLNTLPSRDALKSIFYLKQITHIILKPSTKHNQSYFKF